jgi:hypothetical protein
MRTGGLKRMWRFVFQHPAIDTGKPADKDHTAVDKLIVRIDRDLL